MKRRLLALLLVLTLVLSMFTGCSDEKKSKKSKEGTKTEATDSNYFNELKKMSSVKTGKSTTGLHVTVKTSEVPNDAESQQILDMLKVNNGEYAADIILDSKVESNTKVSVKVSVKPGSAETIELGTIAIDGSVLYLDLEPTFELIKAQMPDQADQIDAALAQYGMSPVMSLDITKFYSQLISVAKDKLGEEGAEISDMIAAYESMLNSFNITDEQVQAVTDLADKLLEALAKDFDKTLGTDGDEYTLTIGSDNAEDVVNALITFIEKDGAALINELADFIITFFGEDSEIGQQFKAELEQEDISSEIAKAAEEAKQNKDKMVQELKDANFNIVSKASVTGEEGSRKATFSIETGDIAIEDDITISASLTSETEEGGISADIPNNATDMTETLIQLIQFYAAMAQSGADTGLY